jgi:hypothetical protein
VREHDRQCGIQHGVTGGGRITDDEAPRLTRVRLTGEVNLAQQDQFGQGRTA